MDKKKSNVYKDIVDAYVGNKKEGADLSQNDEPQKSVKAKAERTPSKGELSGNALEESLAPDVQNLIQLRKGRRRKIELQNQGVWIRTSFMMRANFMEKLRAISIIEDTSLKAVVDEAFRNAIEAYERKNGEIIFADVKPIKKGIEGIFSD